MTTTAGSAEGESMQAAQAYWDSAAETYEDVFSGTTIGKTRREAVWQDLKRLFRRDDHVLEINCGTGLDAVFLAKEGVKVIACDISPRMIEMARKHAASESVSGCIEFLPLATENLADLGNRDAFDGAFSNFSGLNCVEDLSAVQVQLAKRLKKGAPLLLCMIGRVALWEVFWFLLHGKPDRAFQRLREKTASIGGTTGLKIHRPSVEEIRSRFEPSFRLRRWRGIGITVPPSYVEHWARQFPRIVHFLARLDEKIGRLPGFRNFADCVVLEFERVEEN